ncbi:MAG: DeoR/GlpR family DNA-binding transcription regulator [Victivallales bacterium]
MGKLEKRTEKLIGLLKSAEKLDIASVVSALKISEATARRLFTLLENEGKVIRIHGGVRLAPELGYDYSFRILASRRKEQKSAIGEAAAEIVGNGDILFLDSGTTILRFAEALSRKIQAGELKGVSVVTNSLSYIETLSTCCKVILTGGEIRTERRDVCGGVAEKNLSQYHFNKVFLGADAINLEKGFMTSDEKTAEICRIAISNSNLTFVLADSEKFNRKSFVTYADIGSVEEIITDGNLDKRTRKSFEKKGIRIRSAEV